MAEPTGLEPATSDVTGRRSNQLNYDSAKPFSIFKSLKSQIQPSGADASADVQDQAIQPTQPFEILDLRSEIFKLVGTEGLEPPTSSL